MSDYQRYWYFRFADNFFDKTEIIEMEYEPSGYEYLIILLKLYCKSVGQNGVLRIKARDMKDMQVLSGMTRHKPEVLTCAIQYFIDHGFIEVLEPVEDNVIKMEMPYVKDMIGRSSKRADAVRLQRHEQNRLQAPAAEQDRGELLKCGSFGNVLISENEKREFERQYENAGKIINRLSIFKKRENKNYDDDYAALLGFAEKDGIRSSSSQNQKSRLYEYYKYLHEKAEADADRRKRLIRAKIPDLVGVEKKITELLKEQVGAVVSGRTAEEKENIAEALKGYQEEKIVLLAQYGYTESDMQPHYLCSICQDTGITDEGTACSCQSKRAKEAAKWKNEQQ